MFTTPPGLVQRLSQPGEELAWRRFVHLYTPLLLRWVRQAGIPETDTADVVQDVLILLVRKLPTFTYDPDRTFRGWLRTLTINRCRTIQRRCSLPMDDDLTDQVEAVRADIVAEEIEYRHYLVGRALELMREEFQATTWQACWEHVALGKSVAVVAAELGITVNAVYIAKSRVLHLLRRELDGLLD